MRTIISSTPKFQLLFLVFIVLLSSSCSSSRKVRKKNIDQVVSTAKSFHGTPYRFGGTTRAGMDCSALLLHSFSSVGVTLPRTSEAQSKIGRRVTVQSLKKGDVVFFATGRKRRQVTHAGIVTSNNRGNIQFIHASTSLGVTEDAINSDYWSKKFVVGRRVF